jgi:hypothetical protein
MIIVTCIDMYLYVVCLQPWHAVCEYMTVWVVNMWVAAFASVSCGTLAGRVLLAD